MSSFADSIGQPLAGTRSRPSTGATATALARRLEKVVHACLLTAVFAVPMMSACLQEFGNLLFVGSSLLMGLCWAVQQVLEPRKGSAASGAEVIALAAIGLVCLQQVPLPPDVLAHLAPFTRDTLTLWGTPEGRVLGGHPWQTISLTPALTRSGLVLLIAYVIFFFTLVQTIRTAGDIDRLLRLLAISGTVMAVLALAQLFVGNGLFLWMFEHPFRTASWPAKGAFSNQNHLAHFLALGIGPLIWWWHQSGRTDGHVMRGSTWTNGFGMTRTTEGHRRLLGVAIALVMLTGLLTFSRGGLLAIGAATLMAVSMVHRDWRRLLKLAIPVTIFVALGVGLFGTGYLQQKWNAVRQAGSVQELLQGRFALWSAISDALPSFKAAGSGLGSHAEIYPTWMERDFGVRFSHAESGYLQVLLELGIPGFVLLLAGVLLLAFWVVSAWWGKDRAMTARTTALAAGLVVSVLHSVMDFVWYIPGCMIMTLVIAACLCRCHQLSREAARLPAGTARVRWPQILAWLIIVISVPVGQVSADVVLRDANSAYDWNNYRKHSIRARDASSYQSLDSLDERLDAIIMHLENCLQHDPEDYRAAADLSAMYLRRFERHQSTAKNPMSVREIRNTVRSVEFDSHQELAEWLKRAFGHPAADLYRTLKLARRAVQGQPMRGETYLVLAQVGFVMGLTDEEEDKLLEQALKLRPYSAAVLFVSGLTQAEKGDLESAMVHWQQAFRLDAAMRPMIVKGLVPYVSASEFIEKLNPGPDGLWLMYTEYRALEKTEAQETVANWYARNFEHFASDPSVERGRFFWQRSHDLFEFIGRSRQALACLKLAVKQTPHDYDLRKMLALELLETGSTDDAIRQLEWCQVRMPDDVQIIEALKQIEGKSRSRGDR